MSERRQTMLFSATQTRKTEDLARISLKKEPIYVGVDDSKEVATVEGLEQVGAHHEFQWLTSIQELNLTYCPVNLGPSEIEKQFTIAKELVLVVLCLRDFDRNSCLN